MQEGSQKQVNPNKTRLMQTSQKKKKTKAAEDINIEEIDNYLDEKEKDLDASKQNLCYRLVTESKEYSIKEENGMSNLQN